MEMISSARCQVGSPGRWATPYSVTTLSPTASSASAPLLMVKLESQLDAFQDTTLADSNT